RGVSPRSEGGGDSHPGPGRARVKFYKRSGLLGRFDTRGRAPQASSLRAWPDSDLRRPVSWLVAPSCFWGLVMVTRVLQPPRAATREALVPLATIRLAAVKAAAPVASTRAREDPV